MALSAARKVIRSALQLACSGGIYIPPRPSRDWSRRPRRRSHPHLAAPAISQPGQPAVWPADLGLTERQVDVLALMVQRKSDRAICRMLNLAQPSVKNHVRAVLKALKVTNRTEAVIAVGALQWELPSVANP